MHIAFLSPEYPHPLSSPSAGLGNSIRNLALQLAQNGIRVTIFIYGQEKNSLFEKNGISFHFIEQQYYKIAGWWRYRKFLENYINKIIKIERIDLLEAPDWTGITAFMKIKCPLIIRLHGSDSYFCKLENREQKWKNFLFEKIALQKADYLLSVSQFTAKKTKHIFSLQKEIQVIFNSVDVNIFKPTGEDIKLENILYFGSIIRKKGVLELPEIFTRVRQTNPEANLIIAGRVVQDIITGKSTKELFLERLDSETAKNVQWTGSLPYENVIQEISKAALVVLPSFAEALPMTWIEAMAMEKAIVTSDIGWAKEVMIDGETGFTVDPKDHKKYAGKILQLMNDSALAVKMGRAARKRVIEKFSTEVVVEQNIRFYENVVKANSTNDH